MKVEIMKTYAPPRPPLRPKVIPMFATPAIFRRSRTTPSIHQNLPAKPRYHPYGERTSQPELAHEVPAPDEPTITTTKPSPLGIPSANDDEEEALERTSEIILTEQPQGFTLVNSGWSDTKLKSLRRHAKQAIQAHLKVGVRLSAQEPDAIAKARQVILDAFPDFREHKNAWGADAVLRDQLKTIRDCTNARNRKARLESVGVSEQGSSKDT
ncbi:hypothetical protein VNI00_008924 [Paramarasmius palmivorus]|uniref:BEN domain-containing protein n=1 Tax=Paramarasmius palmivorus TaxID=297713 RepID=A0AAW0CS60_9AGAR